MICRPWLRRWKPMRCVVPGKKTLSASRMRAWPGRRARPRGCSAPDQHDRRPAVAEDRGGHDVGGRAVPALEGEARELERQDERRAVGVGDQVVARAGQADHAAGAAALGDGQADQPRAHAQRVRHVGVDGRDHEAGAGDADDEADVGGRRARRWRGRGAPGPLPSRRRSRGRRSFWVSKSPGWKTSSMGTTLARAAHSRRGVDGQQAAAGCASSPSQSRTQRVTSSCS